MQTTFKTNGAATTKTLTEWYFGKAFVERQIRIAQKESLKNNKTEFRFWQDGTGYLTVCIEK